MLLWSCSVAALITQGLAAPPSLSEGPFVLLDDADLEHHAGVERVIIRPRRLEQPVITGPEDQCFQPYVTVVRDPDTGRFRVWYGVPESASQSHVATMESDDGIHWERPHRILQDPAHIQFGVSIIDEGPALEPPEQRYKFGWWGEGGLRVAASANGLDFTLMSDEVVLFHNHDINCIFRDPIRDRYLAMVSVYTAGDSWTGERRIPHQSVSDDLLHWEEPWRIIAPDEKDEGETQFYCMGGLIARGPLLIGMLRVLRDDLPADPDGPVAGMGYTVLAWSRDGRTWERDREPFMDRNPEPGSWDHAMTWADCQLLVDDETYIYYGGYARGHKVERFTERQIGLARMPRDRYVAWRASGPRGRVVTCPMSVDVDQLTVNADIAGEIRVRLLDGNGRPLRGFDFDDCVPVHGDGIALPVKWARRLAEVRGASVRLEFALRKADLYAFGP